MADEIPTPQPPKPDSVTIKKSRLYLIVGVALLVVLGGFFLMHKSSPVPAATEKKPEPAFHRDEPTETQIFQPDYKQKVHEMLDSGKSVMEISRDTKIKVDEIRKIKKEYKQMKDSAEAKHKKINR